MRQLGTGLDLRQQRTRKHQRLSDSIGLADDAQAVGIAVGDEDAEGERGLHMLSVHFAFKLWSSQPHAAKARWPAKQMQRQTL